MTPPAEGERAREIATKIAWSYSGYLNGRLCEKLTDEIAAALRAPQPRGLTGDAIREECAKVADDIIAKAYDSPEFYAVDVLETVASAIRALNLSAIAGAPAAGERDLTATLQGMYEALSRVLRGEPQPNGEYLHLVECSGDRRSPPGVWGHSCVCKPSGAKVGAPASPRSAAPESPRHVCGLQGFGAPGDVCIPCAVRTAAATYDHGDHPDAI